MISSAKLLPVMTVLRIECLANRNNARVAKWQGGDYA